MAKRLCIAAQVTAHVVCTGFVASGPLVVLAEAALRIGAKPSYIQQLLLFELVAALTVAGTCFVCCAWHESPA